MPNVISGDGSPSPSSMNGLVQDLLVQQRISVCITIQEIMQDASIDHHTLYCPLFQYITGMTIEYLCCDKASSSYETLTGHILDNQ